MILFDIDGTILDMRYLIHFVLRSYDRKHQTDYFHNLKLSEIDVHEDDILPLFRRLQVPKDAEDSILRWYLLNRWSPVFLLEAHRPFRGVLEVIRWFLIQPNTYVVFEPEPQEVQAIDGYPVEIAVWLGRDEGTQRQEARLVFEDHVRTRPDVPVLLCHDVSALIAAYLPEKGVYDFPPGTTIDAAHQDRWRDWALA